MKDRTHTRITKAYIPDKENCLPHIHVTESQKKRKLLEVNPSNPYTAALILSVWSTYSYYICPLYLNGV